MSDLKWSRRHDQITVLNSLEEEEGLNKENHIIVLLKILKQNMPWISKLVEQITLLNTSYGIIGVFLMAFSTIKTLCICLKTIMMCGNQSVIPFMRNIKHMSSNGPISLTQLLSLLYSNMSGFLCESQYSSKTRQMLDDYYPRALQWCSTEQ